MERDQISTAVNTLGINNEKIEAQAGEYFRRSKIRCPMLGEGEVARIYVCIGIACRLLKTDFPKKKALQACGVSDSLYQQTFGTLCSVLDVVITVTAKELSSTFPEINTGTGVRLIKSTEKTLEKYKAKFLENVPESQKSSTNFSKPVFIGAAFHICCSYFKIKISKKDLILYLETTSREFQRVEYSILELVYGRNIEELKKQQEDKKQKNKLSKKKNTKKRKLPEAELLEPGEDDKETKLKKRKIEQEEFKEKLLDENKKQREEQQQIGSQKQLTLFDTFNTDAPEEIIEIDKE